MDTSWHMPDSPGELALESAGMSIRTGNLLDDPNALGLAFTRQLDGDTTQVTLVVARWADQHDRARFAAWCVAELAHLWAGEDGAAARWGHGENGWLYRFCRPSDDGGAQ